MAAARDWVAATPTSSSTRRAMTTWWRQATAGAAAHTTRKAAPSTTPAWFLLMKGSDAGSNPRETALKVAITASTEEPSTKSRRAGRTTPACTMATPIRIDPPKSRPRWPHSSTDRSALFDTRVMARAPM